MGASTSRLLTIRVQAAHQDRQAATQSLGNPYLVGERREGCRRQAGHDLAAVAPAIGQAVGATEKAPWRRKSNPRLTSP